VVNMAAVFWTAFSVETL